MSNNCPIKANTKKTTKEITFLIRIKEITLQEMEVLLKMGAVQQVCSQTNQFLSGIFLVKKGDGTIHLS